MIDRVQEGANSYNPGYDPAELRLVLAEQAAVALKAAEQATVVDPPGMHPAGELPVE
jgi:hypothetical protein